MARKPEDKPPVRAGTPRRAAPRSQAATKKGSRPLDVAALGRELLAARARIGELEKTQRELSRKIEVAIAAIHKLLEGG